MANWQENYQLYKRYVKNIAIIYNRRRDVRTYIELMLSISVIVIFGMFAVRPTFVTIIELKKDITNKENTLRLLSKKIADLDRAQKVKVQYSRQLALLKTAVPDGPLPAQYARQIEGLAKRHDAQLFALEAQSVPILGESKTKDTTSDEIDPKITDRYPTVAASIDYSFDIIGSYENIIALIKDLEKLRRPIFVDTMRLRASDNFDNDGIIVLSVSGRVPFVPEQL